MYLISAYFDNKTNTVLEKHIDEVARATGNSFMTENKVPPHLTVAAIEARSVKELRQPFLDMAKGLKAGSISLVSTGQLLPYVFYVTPVLNEYLTELSNKVYCAFKDLPDTEISKYYRPGNWLPHVTIGKKLSEEQMKQAFEVMYKRFQPLEAEIVEIGLSKVNPHEDVERVLLK